MIEAIGRTSMTKDETLKLALEALEAAYARLVTKCEQNLVTYNGVDVDTLTLSQEAITAIKEALAQPEQKSDGVALTNIPHPNGAPAPDDLNADALEVVELELPDEDEAVGWADGGVINWIAGKQFKHASYLYATPPQRKPLTDEEIKAVCAETWSYDPYVIARAIEAAHGIKGEA